MIVEANQVLTLKTILTMPHDHCWHDNGELLLTEPPQLQQICCWCGEQRTIRIGVKPQQQHGPYIGKSNRD